MIAQNKPHLRLFIYALCALLLIACSEQNDVSKTIKPAPIQYQTPPVINSSSASFNGPRSDYAVTITTSARRRRILGLSIHSTVLRKNCFQVREASPVRLAINKPRPIARHISR